MKQSKLANSQSDLLWKEDTVHKEWLREEAMQQLAFFSQSLAPSGQLRSLNWDGSEIIGASQELHSTTRLVHSYALGKHLGFAGSEGIIEAGLRALREGHKDQTHGGYIWSFDAKGPCDTKKLAYGHVFVLLAAASALQAGFDEAYDIISDVCDTLDTYFWDETVGRFRDEFNSDWTPFSTYRGMNANMHGAEALLAAHEATGERHYLDRAGQILDFFVGFIAPQYDWRIPEHYDEDWNVDLHYEGNPMFRPSGTTPGHSFEFARLRLQHWDLTGRPDGTAAAEARSLIQTALKDAWLPEGGFCYTLDAEGKIKVRERFWWPVTEAIGAISVLQQADRQEEDEKWYRQLWQFSDQYLIDHSFGGWFGVIDAQNRPSQTQFKGKPDIYHSLQAALIPLTSSISHLHKALRAIG